jgi:hypothetical protein
MTETELIAKVAGGKRKEIEGMRIHKWKSGKKRWFLTIAAITFGLELGRIRGMRWGYVAYGGQDTFAKMSAGLGWGFWLTVDTPFKWNRIRPRDGKYGEAHCEFGWKWNHGQLSLQFGHDPIGTWYAGGKGPRARRALRQTWKNRELSLWKNEWVAGRTKTHWEDLAEFPFVLNVGQWEGDAYAGTMKIRRLRWQRRFRKGKRLDWDFSMPSPGNGIPIPGNIDSDFYDGDDAIFAFGESADDWSLEQAAERLRERVIRDRGKWRPAGVAA